MAGSGKRIDVVLVNPGSRAAVYQELGDQYSAIEPPSLAGLFATYLRKHALSVAIVDAPALNLSPAGVAKTIYENFEPALIVMVVYGFQPSASTQNMTAAGETCAAIKALRADWPIMMTGTHPAALPERTMLEEKIDFVCDREGPETILLTAQTLKAHAKNFSGIPSLWYRDGKALRSNPHGELMDDLDGEMPGVAWDLLPMEKYRAHNWHCFEDIHHRAPYISMHTSLGCPYKCTFCLREGTIIVTAKGKNKRIEDLVVGDRLLAWDEKAEDIVETRISKTASRVVDRLLRITMSSGEIIDVTDEHPIYTERGWVEAGHVSTSDRVLVMETRDKMRYQMRTNNPTRNGLTAEWRNSIGRSVRGMRRSAESKERYRLSKLGDKNPMKRPEVALAPALRESRSQRMKELWADPQRAAAFNATRPTGEKHSRWAGGLSRYPWPLKFSDFLKKRIRKRDSETCQECGTKAGLTVHHIDYDKNNCDDCNLITLCRRCNSRANANRHEWQAKYSAMLSARGQCPRYQEVKSIQELRGEFRVYNFECSPHDNYWAHRILVHNCCINAPFGKPSYRLWSPESVIQEIDLLVERHGVRNIKFVDEMFVLNRNHVLGICDRIIERGHKLNIWAYARVDTVKDEFLDKLARAGFRWLALGIESGSKHVRDGVEKGRFGSPEILKVVKKIQDAGINVIGNYIFGLPDDTHESMQETLDLALEANCEFANFYCAMAYPGSKLYAMAVEKKWPLPDSWIGYSQHSYETFPLRTDALTSAEVLAFRDDAFHRYFTSESYLALVRRKFGEDVVGHIRGMTKIRLKRRLLESGATPTTPSHRATPPRAGGEVMPSRPVRP
ncbi:MAG TPA: radical SAM protein [Burkholderiales bacterium]|jgi:radical SAM superfamily enzyme YgiQ (UPF0313 family)